MCFNGEDREFIAYSGEVETRHSLTQMLLQCSWAYNWTVSSCAPEECSEGEDLSQWHQHLRDTQKLALCSSHGAWQMLLMWLGKQTYLEKQNNFEIVFKIMGTNTWLLSSATIWYDLKCQKDLSQILKEVGGNKPISFTSLLDRIHINNVITSESMWKWVLILEIKWML